MPQLGEIKRACEIGYKWSGHKYIWHACLDCGKERWVLLRHNVPISERCRSCSTKNNNWRGGAHITTAGYRRIYLPKTDFFYSMTQQNGQVLEHRLVMAKYLGRCLQPWEIVHHKKGVAKDDNRIEGLQLVSDDRHNQITILENKIRHLEQKIKLLQWQMKELRLKQPVK